MFQLRCDRQRYEIQPVEVYSKKPEIKEGETVVFAKTEAPIKKK